MTDAGGRVVYANAAYLELTEASGSDDTRPIERVFVGDPGVSEAVYRLLRAAREGRRLQEEVRVGGRKGEPGRWLRMRVRPLGEGRHPAGLTVWSIADVTRELERQENVFQELQNAIDYLDHAPAGFFSVDANGEIGYLNATLAEWLDYDLAQFGAGGLKLDQLVAGQGAALLTTLSAAPGEVKTEIFDIDLKTRGGRTLPVRLFHKVAFGADGAPGSSRTLVLNRARDHGSDPQRLAEVRFMRFFHNTPMAIATVDRPGRIIRSNVLFARLFRPVLKTDGPDGRLDSRRWSPSAIARRSKPRSAAPPTSRARSPRSMPRSPVRASASPVSTSPRSRRRWATTRRPSSTASRPPSSARSRASSPNPRRWSWSASSPAASRTTSTTCSAPS